MELRLVLLLARLLDPRRWRLRLAQLGIASGATLWLWYRSVDVSDERRAVRDARRAARDARIQTRLRTLEQQRGSLR